jgi:hypothetical protein
MTTPTHTPAPAAPPGRPAILPAVARVLASRVALATGLRQRPDGWRRAAGLVLRSEASTFVLSAFGLDAWSDLRQTSHASPHEPHDTASTQSHLEHRLAAFLASEPRFRIRVITHGIEDRAEPSPTPGFTLRFEPMPEGPARFVAPASWKPDPTHSHPTASAIANLVCRVSHLGACDVWARFNHAVIDGVPAQEIMSRLETAWGSAEPVTFPTPEAFEPLATPRTSPGRADLAEIQSFVDFAPLLAWRKQVNATLPEPLTVTGAILWRLGQHPSLAGLHLGTTVETAAQGAIDRGVGVISVIPRNYAPRPNGLARFAQDFAREMERTRRRATSGCKALDAAALIPQSSARALLDRTLERSPRVFGAAALSMLKDAKVFGAPISEVGHPRGLMTIGSLSLPATDGRKVGCVCVKGPREAIAPYPRILREVMSS